MKTSLFHAKRFFISPHFLCTVHTSVYECVQARHRRVDGGRRQRGRVCVHAQSGFCSSGDDIKRDRGL